MSLAIIILIAVVIGSFITGASRNEYESPKARKYREQAERIKRDEERMQEAKESLERLKRFGSSSSENEWPFGGFARPITPSAPSSGWQEMAFPSITRPSTPFVPPTPPVERTFPMMDRSMNAAPSAAASDFPVGGVVTLGRYAGEDADWNESEEIEWIVVENNGIMAVLISKGFLDIVPDYDPYENDFQPGGLTETAAESYASFYRNRNRSIVDTLNDRFVKQAFTDEERVRVRRLDLPTPGDVVRWFPEEEARVCTWLGLAFRAGSQGLTRGPVAGSWRLQTPGSDETVTKYVGTDGRIATKDIYDSNLFVRPAMLLGL